MFDGGFLLVALTLGSSAPTPCSPPPAVDRVPVGNELVNDGAERVAQLKRISLKERTMVRLAVDWILEHQDDDGRWDADEFMKRDPEKDRCGGPGQPEHDVGLTSLALMALMGGVELKEGTDPRRAVEAGLAWLASQQNPESGLVGDKIGHAYLYNHALATTCLCEAIVVLDREDLELVAQRAVGCVEAARNENAGWRYELPPNKENDTSVTALMIDALATARDAGLVVDQKAFAGARFWLDSVTDVATGRVGYDSVGSASARVPGVNDSYPTDKTEVMTAAGLATRFLCGQRPESEPMLARHAGLVLEHLPIWSDQGLGTDFYYWYHGSQALHQMGEKDWKIWRKSLVEVLAESQQKRGAARGSWDPVGPWGFSGGRVYSTSIAVLCLTTPVRHKRLIGD